jgi:hypothetical protein
LASKNCTGGTEGGQEAGPGHDERRLHRTQQFGAEQHGLDGEKEEEEAQHPDSITEG